MLAATPRTNASSAVPSKNRTAIMSCLLRVAAVNRCMPSMTRIVGWCTLIGGMSAASIIPAA
jgi:hypothetical protein